MAPVMGMTFAFGWTPCITPVLAAVLGLASSGGTLARGEEMLVAYSLGLGVPFVVTGLAFGRLSGALRFARRHSRAVSLVSGLVLATLGVLIITGEVGTISSWSSSFLQHIGLGGLATGWPRRHGAANRGPPLAPDQAGWLELNGRYGNSAGRSPSLRGCSGRPYPLLAGADSDVATGGIRRAQRG